MNTYKEYTSSNTAQKNNIWRVAVGRKIATLRRRNGLTQKEFADRIAVSTSYVSKIENGSAIDGLTLFVLETIAVGLQASSAEILQLSSRDIRRGEEFLSTRVR